MSRYLTYFQVPSGQLTVGIYLFINVLEMEPKVLYMLDKHSTSGYILSPRVVLKDLWYGHIILITVTQVCQMKKYMYYG